MAKSSKPEKSFLLSVVHKENAVSENLQNDATKAAGAVEDAASQAMRDIAEQLKALREQVQALQASTGEIAAQAGKVVASTARVAGDKISSSAHEARDRVATSARAAGEKVTSTVETYPISAVLIASAAAFLMGRLSASAFSHSQPAFAENTLDQLKSRLHDLSGRLPPHLKSALRSSLR